jgi:hypothetical protein
MALKVNFNDDFFKFIFFDQYLTDIGSSKFKVIQTFANYLKQVNHIDNWFTKYFLEKSELELNDESISDETVSNIDIGIPFLLLSGWSGSPGHAINIYIEKIADNNYNLSIINSGSGVEFHIEYSQSTSEANIILNFKNITKNIIEKIFLINKFFNNNSRSKIVEDFIKQNKTNVLYKIPEVIWDDKKNGYCNIAIYNNESNVSYEYYKQIFSILEPNKPNSKIKDKIQISSTCTFFSSYYFLKYFIFTKIEDFDIFIKNIRIHLINEFNNTLDDYYSLSNNDRLNILNVANTLIKDYKDIDTKLTELILEKIILKYNFKDTLIGDYIPKNKIKKENDNDYIDKTIDEFIKDYKECIDNLEKNEITLDNLSIIHKAKYYKIGIITILLKRLFYKIYKKKNKLKKIKFNMIKPNILYSSLYLHILLTIMEIPEEYKKYEITDEDKKIDEEFKKNTITDSKFKEYLELKLSYIYKTYDILELNDFSNKIIEYRGLFKYDNFIILLPINDFKSIKPPEFKYHDMSKDYYKLNDPNKDQINRIYDELKNNINLTYRFNPGHHNNDLLINNHTEASRNIYYSKVSYNNFDYIVNAINSNNLYEINKIFELSKSEKEELSSIKDNKYPYRYENKLINNKDELINLFNKKHCERYKYQCNGIIIYLLDMSYFFKTDLQNINSNEKYYNYIDNNLYDTFYKNSINKINIESLLKLYKYLSNEMYEDLLILLYINRRDDFNSKSEEILKTLSEESIFKLYLENNFSKIISIYNINSEDNNGDIFGRNCMNYFKINIIYLLLHDNYENEIEFISQIIEKCLIFYNDQQIFKNINLKYEKIENFTYINLINNEFLVAEMNPISVYKNNDKDKDSSIYHYYYNKKLIEIEIIDSNKIIRINDNFELININDENSFIKSLKEEHKIIINKINIACKYYHIWKNDINNDILIELDNYNIQFKLTLTKNLIIINKEEYEIISDYKLLEGLYLVNMNNGFCLKKNDKKYIFLLMMIEYIKLNILNHNNLLNLYFNHFLFKKGEFPGFKEKETNFYNIIELSYNELLIDNNSIIDICALYISLIISKNYICINLIYKKYENILKNEDISKMDESVLKNLIIFYIDLINYCKDDNPYRFLYETDNNNTERNKFLNYYYLNKNIDLDYNSNNYNTNYDITNLIDLVEYKEINKLSDNINKLKDTNLDIYNQTNYIKDYLKTFRNNCNKSNPIKKSEILISIPSQYNLKDFSKSILKNLININSLLVTSICDIFHHNYYIFYEYLIKLKFEKIFNKLNLLDDTEINCTNILEIIEPLDKFIIYIPNKRNFEEVCFELTTGFFLRQEQIDKFIEIKEDLNSSNLSRRVNNKAYEILMGKGKTSTITPLIILYNYFQNKEIFNFNIILPSHLVNQSYKIFLKYSQLLINYNINKNPEYDFLLKEYQINIFSESHIKEIILKKIKAESILLNIKDNKLFIFDEIDSLIDPLKSDLNIPDDKKFDHPLKEKLNEIGIEIIKILLGIKPTTNNESDKIKIKNNKDEIIYTFSINNDIKNLSQSIELKINKTIKIIESLIFKKDYGFGDYNHTENENNKKHFYTSIPYSAINSPLNESEFTDYELCLFLTIKNYFQNEMRPEDIQLLFITASIDYNYNIDIFNLKYKILYDIIDEKTFIDNIVLVNSVNFNNNCKIISDKIKTNPKKYILLEYYLNYIIFPKYFKIYKSQSNISTIDLFNKNLSSKKISFSGTVNFEKPSDVIDGILEKTHLYIQNIKLDCISDIIEDNSSKGSIISSILGITTIKPNNIYYNETNDNNAIENDLIEYLFTKKNINNYQCLIDAGGLFLKTSVIEMVEKINNNISGVYFKYILYVTNNDYQMCYDMIEKKHIIYNDEVYNNVFIYYDHKHCVGIDFKQPNKLHGLVTIHKNDTLTRISQGIFRLRKINKGHTIDFYLPQKLEKNQTNSNFIYDYLNGVEISYKNNTLKYMQLQCIKFIFRNIINKNESYEDLLYYDLIKYTKEDIYINYNEFIKQLIEKYNDKIVSLDIKFKNIIFDDNLTKIEQQKNINVSKEIDQNIELKQNINQNKIGYIISNPIIYDYINIEPYKIFNQYYFEYNSFSCHELLRIDDIQINLSTSYIEIFLTKENQTDYNPRDEFLSENFRAFNNKNEYFFKNKLYYLYDKSNDNLIILYEIDYYNILDEINREKKRNNFYKTSELIIYDIYGNIVLNQKPEKEIPIKIINLLENIFFKKRKSLIDMFNYLFELRKRDNYLNLKLDLYTTMFNININFNLSSLAFNYLIYFRIKDWCSLFDIPNNDTNYNMLSKLINIYIYNYKSKNILLYDSIRVYTHDLNEIEYEYLYKLVCDITINNEIYTEEIKINTLQKISSYGDDYIKLINKIKSNIGIEKDFTINKKLNEIKIILDETLEKIYSINDYLFIYNSDIYNSKLEKKYTDIKIDKLTKTLKKYSPSEINNYNYNELKENLDQSNLRIEELNLIISKKLNINYDEIHYIIKNLSKISFEINNEKYYSLKNIQEFIISELKTILSI